MRTRTIQIEANLDDKNIGTKKATRAGRRWNACFDRLTDYQPIISYQSPITDRRFLQPISTQVQSSLAKRTKLFNSALESLLM